MRSTHRKLATLAGLLVFAAFAPAVGNAQLCGLTSGAAIYTIPATSHYDISPTSNLTGVGTGDYIFEDGWFFRVAGDAQEFFFPAPTTTTCAGATGTITWADVNARGLFSASNGLALLSTIAGQGELILSMAITNLSASNPLVISLFHAVDFDVNNSAGTDTATLLEANNWMRIADGAEFAEYRSFLPVSNAFLVRPFAAATDVFGVLGNASVTNFDNTTLPSNSIDFTGGFQWDLNIPPSGTATVRVALQGNGPSTTPVDLQSFSVE